MWNDAFAERQMPASKDLMQAESGMWPAVLVEVAFVGTRGLRISSQWADITRFLINEVRRGKQETCATAHWIMTI